MKASTRTKRLVLRRLALSDQQLVDELCEIEYGLSDWELDFVEAVASKVYDDKKALTSKERAKRAATTVRLDHFTPQQRLCLMKRWHAGGNSFLLLQVGDDWLLFDGDVAAEKVGRVNKEELYIIAKVTWFRPELKDVLAEQLSR